MKKQLLCLVLMCVDMAIVNAADKKGLALINGGTPSPIYAQAEALSFGKALSGYLKQMSGKDFQVITLKDAVIPEGPGIVVNVADEKAAKLGGDSYTIRTEGDKLYLTGETPMAAGFAVFAFLEDQLGCKWWSFNEEEVPGNTELNVGNLALVVKAPFRQPVLSIKEAQFPDRADPGFGYKTKMIATEGFTGGHTAYGLLKDHAASHPEIYPMNKNGERKGNDLHFCYLAPGIVDALCDGFEKEITKRKGNIRDWIYFAGMGDWYGGMCECPECKKVYEEETWTDPDGKAYPGYTATLLRMMNAVGEKMEKKYPGIRVGTFAYMSLDAPPAKTMPRGNVVLQVPHLRYCNAHAVAACKENKPYLSKLKRWLEIAAPGNVYVWDYSMFADCFLWPGAELRSLAASLKTYRELGCAGVSVEGNYISPGSDLVVLKNYVWRKVMWDPQADVEGLIDEFCAGYYGPAAATMKAYVNLLEDAAAKSAGFDSFAEAPKLRERLFTPELVERLREARAAALASAGDREPYLRRVKEGTNGLEAWELNGMNPLPYLLAPKDGYLAVNGVVTWPRAVEMIKYSRNSTFREWGTPLFYQEMFLRSQGGPLVTLQRDGVEAVVAPTQSGRIYQLSYRGKPLLRSQFDSTDRTLRTRLLNVPTIFRGSFEHVTNRLRKGRPEHPHLFTERDRQESAVTMEGNVDVDTWQGGLIRAVKTVEVKAGGIVRISGKTHTLDWQRKPVDIPEQVTTITDYRVQTGTVFTVESSPDGTTWNKVDPAAFVPPVTTNGAPAKATTPLQCSVAGPVKSLRIGLPGSAVMVEDVYAGPAVEKVELIWDQAQGVLTSEVTTAPDAAGKWPEREIRCSGQ